MRIIFGWLVCQSLFFEKRNNTTREDGYAIRKEYHAETVQAKKKTQQQICAAGRDY